MTPAATMTMAALLLAGVAVAVASAGPTALDDAFCAFQANSVARSVVTWAVAGKDAAPREPEPSECEQSPANEPWERWPVERKVRCCYDRALRCRETQVHLNHCHATQESAVSWPGSKREWCCRHKGVRCNQTEQEQLRFKDFGPRQWPYDCRQKVKPWTEWTPEHKSWCCMADGLKCDLVKRLGLRADDAPAAGAAQDSTNQARNSFVCLEGANESHLWSQEKRDWCTNCQQGLDTWKHWDSYKKAWCCRSEGLACREAERYIFNCRRDESSYTAWSSKKKLWCCKYKGEKCLDSRVRRTDWGPQQWPHECLREQDSWERWSPTRQRWCCRVEGLRCQDLSGESSLEAPGVADWQEQVREEAEPTEQPAEPQAPAVGMPDHTPEAEAEAKPPASEEIATVGDSAKAEPSEPSEAKPSAEEVSSAAAEPSPPMAADGNASKEQPRTEEATDPVAAEAHSQSVAEPESGATQAAPYAQNSPERHIFGDNEDDDDAQPSKPSEAKPSAEEVSSAAAEPGPPMAADGNASKEQPRTEEATDPRAAEAHSQSVAEPESGAAQAAPDSQSSPEAAPDPGSSVQRHIFGDEVNEDAQPSKPSEAKPSAEEVSSAAAEPSPPMAADGNASKEQPRTEEATDPVAAEAHSQSVAEPESGAAQAAPDAQSSPEAAPDSASNVHRHAFGDDEDDVGDQDDDDDDAQPGKPSEAKPSAEEVSSAAAEPSPQMAADGNASKEQPRTEEATDPRAAEAHSQSVAEPESGAAQAAPDAQSSPEAAPDPASNVQRHTVGDEVNEDAQPSKPSEAKPSTEEVSSAAAEPESGAVQATPDAQSSPEAAPDPASNVHRHTVGDEEDDEDNQLSTPPASQAPVAAEQLDTRPECWNAGDRVEIAAHSEFADQAKGTCATVSESTCVGNGYRLLNFENGYSNWYEHADLEPCRLAHQEASKEAAEERGPAQAAQSKLLSEVARQPFTEQASTTFTVPDAEEARQPFTEPATTDPPLPEPEQLRPEAARGTAGSEGLPAEAPQKSSMWVVERRVTTDGTEQPAERKPPPPEAERQPATPIAQLQARGDPAPPAAGQEAAAGTAPSQASWQVPRPMERGRDAEREEEEERKPAAEEASRGPEYNVEWQRMREAGEEEGDDEDDDDEEPLTREVIAKEAAALVSSNKEATALPHAQVDREPSGGEARSPSRPGSREDGLLVADEPAADAAVFRAQVRADLEEDGLDMAGK